MDEFVIRSRSTGMYFSSLGTFVEDVGRAFRFEDEKEAWENVHEETEEMVELDRQDRVIRVLTKEG